MYVPAALTVVWLITGFCNKLVKPLGPLHINPGPVPPAPRLSACPTHTGVLAVIVGEAGIAITCAWSVSTAVQPLSVAANL
ncbi:MAG: hypothetical protein ACTHKV_12690 [Flavipsychrobacter sp.]